MEGFAMEQRSPRVAGGLQSARKAIDTGLQTVVLPSNKLLWDCS